MTQSRDVKIDIERVFEAPRELVFENWTKAEHLGAWFSPAGFDVVDCSVDHRPGGHWRISYRSHSGSGYVEYGQFIDIEAPERLRFTLITEDDSGKVLLRSEVLISLHEQDGNTTMSFLQTGFHSRGQRDSMTQGWQTCFEKLDQQIAEEQELRGLFGNWFQASEQKDLDASMQPIAPDIVSYEHDAPLAYEGVDEVRAVCKAGFDQMPDGFRWDVPDLRVIVRGDIAVTWGLNRMRGPGVELWSRGTRIFQRLDGHWRMIHQHVSFPYDPESGAARLDIRP